jgi:DNA-binding transcriptional MerR regulator
MTDDYLKLWTIDELGSQAALALAMVSDYSGQASGRVRDVPDRRTIRYYITLGLIDPPEKMWARTALYGRRHLLQLVAIKRLQAKGLTLAELQARLVGQTDAVLEKLARVPPQFSPHGQRSAAPSDAGERATPFWKTAAEATAPVEGEEGAATNPSPTKDGEEGRVPLAVTTDSSPIIDLKGIRLADAVMLLLSPARPVESDDMEAIHIVAAPLLKLLKKRHLLRPHPERRNA